MPFLPAIEVEPVATANAAVIWLHGLGASGHDFEPIVPELQLPASMAVRFVFPHAPERPVTINGGYVMPAWYDILEMNFERKIDQAQIQASAADIKALIQREIDRGIPSQRIVLAGFSQGGAVAYETALSFQQPLAGLMALSTYFATAHTVQPHPANKALPIFVFHGVYDPVVGEALGQQAVSHLQAMGYHPQYRSYGMEHAVCPQQIADISAWLQQILK